VAPVVLQRLDTLTKEISSTDTQIETRKQEIETETARYDQEIQRYTYLESLKNKPLTAPAEQPASVKK
jgi:hypothetical protein